jgi:hypothetical protein
LTEPKQKGFKKYSQFNHFGTCNFYYKERWLDKKYWREDEEPETNFIKIELTADFFIHDTFLKKFKYLRLQ